VAQAAMIGNPVSMPRVIYLVDEYNTKAGCQKIFMAEVTEQDIMDWQLTANRNGHVACTHGGECLAGLVFAKKYGWVDPHEAAILDSTAHALKFSGFQDMYFEQTFPDEYEVTPRNDLMNAPELIRPADLEQVPEPGRPLEGEALRRFIKRVSEEIATILELKRI
jgi:threonine synthase